MDGYAVASQNVPGTLTISQRVPAGHAPCRSRPGRRQGFSRGEIPAGADAIILQEDAKVAGGQVTLPAAQPASISVGEGAIFNPGTNWWRRGID